MRPEDGSDVTGFGSFDNSTCERVLDLLEPGDLMRANVVCTSVAQSRRHCCYGVIATTAAGTECGAESAEGAIVIAARSRLIIFLHNFLRPLRKL